MRERKFQRAVHRCKSHMLESTQQVQQVLQQRCVVRRGIALMVKPSRTAWELVMTSMAWQHGGFNVAFVPQAVLNVAFDRTIGGNALARKFSRIPRHIVNLRAAAVEAIL